MKIHINGQDHITKMAAMAINSKNLQKPSPPESDLFYGNMNLHGDNY